MKNIFEDVKAFHEKFGLVYDGKPRAVEPRVARFRYRFGIEELEEYQECNSRANEAKHDVDKAEYTHQLAGMLDSFVDQLYVLIGTAYLHGITPEIFQEAWDRVHVQNMLKVRAERAEESKRGSDLDVVKPAGWIAPHHEDLVENNDFK